MACPPFQWPLKLSSQPGRQSTCGTDAMGVGECGLTDRGTQAPWVNWAPSRIHPRVNTAGTGPATQGARHPTGLHSRVDVTLGPWVRGREGIKAWMEVGTDTGVLLPRLRSCRGQSAWAPPGALLAALTRNQPRASCPQVLFWGHTGHMQGFPLILCCRPAPSALPAFPQVWACWLLSTQLGRGSGPRTPEHPRRALSLLS